MLTFLLLLRLLLLKFSIPESVESNSRYFNTNVRLKRILTNCIYLYSASARKNAVHSESPPPPGSFIRSQFRSKSGRLLRKPAIYCSPSFRRSRCIVAVNQPYKNSLFLTLCQPLVRFAPTILQSSIDLSVNDLFDVYK